MYKIYWRKQVKLWLYHKNMDLVKALKELPYDSVNLYSFQHSQRRKASLTQLHFRL